MLIEILFSSVRIQLERKCAISLISMYMLLVKQSSQKRTRQFALWTIVFISSFRVVSLLCLFLREKFTTYLCFILTSLLIQTDTHYYTFSCIVIQMSSNNSRFQPNLNTLPPRSQTRSTSLRVRSSRSSTTDRVLHKTLPSQSPSSSGVIRPRRESLSRE